MTGLFLPPGGGCSRGKRQMFLTPGPLAVPLPRSSASLLRTLPVPHSYVCSVCLSSLFFSIPSFCFLSTSCLPYFLCLSLILLSSSLWLFLFSLSPALFSLSHPSPLTVCPQPRAYFPLDPDAWSGEEKGKGNPQWRSPSPQTMGPRPLTLPTPFPACGGYSV